jgi:hypothetical protein
VDDGVCVGGDSSWLRHWSKELRDWRKKPLSVESMNGLGLKVYVVVIKLKCVTIHGKVMTLLADFISVEIVER